MPDLALHFRLPEAGIAHRFFGRNGVLVVGHAEMTKPDHHRIQLSISPMPWKLREILIQHVIERIVGGFKLFDISCCVQLLHKLAIRKNDVVGARGRLRNQSQQVVAAGIVFRLELDVVRGLELGNDVRLAMAIPGQHIDLSRRGPGARDKGCRQHGGCAVNERLAPGQLRTKKIFGRFHLFTPLIVPHLTRSLFTNQHGEFYRSVKADAAF